MWSGWWLLYVLSIFAHNPHVAIWLLDACCLLTFLKLACWCSALSEYWFGAWVWWMRRWSSCMFLFSGQMFSSSSQLSRSLSFWTRIELVASSASKCVYRTGWHLNCELLGGNEVASHPCSGLQRGTYLFQRTIGGWMCLKKELLRAFFDWLWDRFRML